MGDHGGHYAAASLGGPGESINIAAMVERLNANRVHDLHPADETWRERWKHYQENYYQQEKRWRRLLKANPKTDIFLDIHITFPDPPLDNPTAVSHRPKSFTVYETIDGAKHEPMRFRNDTWPSA